VNGRKTLSRVAYKQASSYLELAAGTYRIQIAVAGTRTIVWSGRVSVRDGRAYTTAALGSATGSGKRFAPVVLNDA
jgi:hypothetical protein